MHAGEAAATRCPGHRVGLCCRPPGNRRWKEAAVAIRSKLPRPLTSTQQRVLIMQLKIRWRTRAAGENLPEMFRRLQQWIGLRAGWRRALPGESRPQRSQSPDQAAAQAIDRFQGERQPHLFRRRLAGQSRKPFQEPLPHQRGRERVARQNLRHQHRKRPPTPVTQTAIGTIHPLAPLPLAAGAQGILTKGVAVPVQRADAAALWTGRLLEGKSWVFNAWASRTKWKGRWNIPTGCLNATGWVELFARHCQQRRDSVQRG